MKLSDVIDLEVNGLFVLLNGKALSGKHYRFDCLKGTYPLKFESTDVAFIEYKVTEKDGFTYSLFIIPPRLVGGFYVKTTAHKSSDDAVQLIWGRGAILAHYLNSDLSVSIKSGLFSPVETVKIGKDWIYTLYNFGKEKVIFLVKYREPWSNTSFIKDNEGEAFFFKSDGSTIKNTNYLVADITEFVPSQKSLLRELEDLIHNA